MWLLAKPSVAERPFSTPLSHTHAKRKKRLYCISHFMATRCTLWMNRGLNISSVLSISFPLRNAYSVHISIFENCVLVPYISCESPGCGSNLSGTLLMPSEPYMLHSDLNPSHFKVHPHHSRLSSPGNGEPGLRGCGRVEEKCVPML